MRVLEIFPGVLTWATLLGAPILSYFHPVWISIYIILFDIYWFLKGANVAAHLMHSHYKLKAHDRIDWMERLTKNLNWRRIYHVIIVPTVKEDIAVLESSIQSYLASDYPKHRLIFVLAIEEREGKDALNKAQILKSRYGSSFFRFYYSVHPDGIVGEARVKGANITYAAKFVQKELDSLGLAYEDVLVSAFDADTTVAKNYFAHLTFDFLTAEKPFQTSYQPMPMFHNNIWDTPAVARVIATSSSFWQMVEASRPDRLITFSSHSMSFKTLVDVGFWRTDIIPEDSHIFWQGFLHYNGDYKTQPLFTTVSMDAVLGETYLKTLVAQYKQKRRWAWGVTEISLVFPSLFKNKKIPFWKKLLYSERLVEGHYFWATASIMIAFLGWLPLIFGGERFGDTVLALNLPFMTRTIMTVATVFLVFSMYVNLVLLPPRPKGYSRFKSFSMIWQWIFTPIVSSVFGSLPAVDAQSRLMLGKYMEFWVTPKVRKTRLPVGNLGQQRISVP